MAAKDPNQERVNEQVLNTLGMMKKMIGEMELEVVDLQRRPGSEASALSINCKGTFGTWGSAGGTFGTFGTFGCAAIAVSETGVTPKQ